MDPMMHDDELPTDAALIRRLLVAQFPQWADLTIEPVRGEGTDNAMYRLGDALAVRAPRRPGAVAGIEREQAWLPRLAPLLPLPLPLPAAMGAPGEGYPWPWSVCRWLEGETLAPEWADARLAADLAGFIRSLQAVDASEAPRGFNQGRGAPLSRWRATIAERLGWLADLHNIGAITAAWEADAAAPAWAGEPVWLHGDLSAGNLLARDGRLSGVIDWGLLGAGDPACELQVAWSLFDAAGRAAFRDAMAVDAATWTRGRAWGLAMGVLNVSYYRQRSPVIAAPGWRAIAAVLADHAGRISAGLL
jgi:aminoglycoside phosphotransferase (APT) family kinase protein